MQTLRVAGLAALLCSGSCLADELATIRVQDSEKALRTGDVVLSETTGSVTRIGQDVLQRPGATLGKVLATVSGTQVRDAGGLGSYSTASLRGSPSEQVMIYLDGMLLNDASHGGVNLSNIDLLQAGQVDVFRGVTPAQLGFAAIGGAIHVQTPDMDQPRNRWLLGLGSFGAQQLNVLQTRPIGQWQSLYSLGLQGADNDFPFRADNGTRFNRNDDINTHRRNAEHRQSSALLKLGRDRGQHRQDLLLQGFDKQQHIPNHINSDANDARLDSRILRGQWQQRWQGVGDWNSRLSLTATDQRERYRDLQGLLGLQRQDETSRSTTLGIGNDWELIRQQHTLTLNAHLRREHYEAEDRLGRIPDSEAHRLQGSLSLQDSRFLLDNRLLLVPALSYQANRDHYDAYSVSEAESPRNGDFDSDFLAPRLGAKFSLTPRLKLFANAARYQRLPAFYELFGDRGIFIGNDELEPETGDNLDLGIEWRGDQRRSLLRASVFSNTIDQAIVRVYDARGIGRSSNIAGAINQGLELELEADLSETTAINLSATLQDTQNRDRNAAFNGRQLPGQAQTSLQLNVQHSLGRWRGVYRLHHRADAFYDSANLLRAADQTIHSVELKRRWNRIELALALNNLSHDVYEDFNGFPKPGRNVFATLTYSGDSIQ